MSRHSIIPTELKELENKADGLNATEAEEEFVLNQIYGLFDFNQTQGSIRRFTEQATAREALDQSQCDKNIREQNQNNHSFKTSSLPNSADSNALVKALPSSTSKIGKINGIDMNFLYKKRGYSPGTKRLWVERNHILKPDKTRIKGKGKESERIQAYRPSQNGRKRIIELNIEFHNSFFHYCETLGTTPLQEFQQNKNESWINNNQSDGESQSSRPKQDKCPTDALQKFRKHETVNLIRLKQTAKKNTLDPEKTKNTAKIIKKAERDFALDLPLLVDETARDIKILNAISAIEKQQLENIFHPYHPHRLHLSTRFVLLFYNDKIVISENMRTTIIAMLHQGHTSAAKMDRLVEAFWWPGMHREIQEKTETCPS